MKKAILAAICALSAALAGCARWQPEQSGPVTLTRACPLQRAPGVADFAGGGVKGVYQFVTQDAAEGDLGSFLRSTDEHGFGLVPLTVTMNGKDTLIAHGPGVLRSQAEVDAEFETACAMGHGSVYLTHVRYNAANEEGGAVRVR